MTINSLLLKDIKQIVYNIVKVTVSHVPFIIQSFLNHTDG